MNILLINQPPFNRGDESAHKGLIRALLNKMPDSNIRILSKLEWIESIRQYSVNNERVRYVYEPMGYLRMYEFFNYCLKSNRKWLMRIHPMFAMYKKHYIWADVVVCAPGGICMGAFQDWEHLQKLYIAKLLRKPLAYYGRSFGPFPVETKDNRIFKKLSLEILHYFCFLSIRDSKTELLANELKIPYVSTVDSAFLDSPKVEIPYEIKKAIGSNPYMVFVPNYLLWHYKYKNKTDHSSIMNFYSRIMDLIWEFNPELNIVMLPQVFGRDKLYAFSDVSMFRDLANMKRDDRIIVSSDNYSSDVQQSIISNAKYVIGARYHSIVFAINQGVPCISLSYEHKMEGLLMTLGKTEWIVDINDTFNSTSTIQTTLDSIRRLIPLLENDDEVRAKAKNKAEVCMDSFVNTVTCL